MGCGATTDALVVQDRRWPSLARRTAAAVALIGAAVAFSASPAGAFGDPSCPHGANEASTACLHGVVQFGDYTEFHNNNMYFTNVASEQAGNHINHTLWTYSGSPCNEWIEEGVTQGYHGQVAYLWYWAYLNSDSYDDFPAGYTTPNGTNHSYESLFNGNGVFIVYRDGSPIAFMNHLGAGTCTAQAGLEVSSGQMSSTHSDTFSLDPLQWQDINSNWHVGWNTSQYWIDQPCGQGYSPPNCANGLFPNSNNWNDNKP